MSARAIPCLVLVAASGFVPAAVAAPPAPAMLASACAGCHGVNGNSASPPIPSIAGLPGDYLAKTMRSAKVGERPTTVMGRLMKGYSDAEIVALARHFGAQKPARVKQNTDPAKVARGQALHNERCKDCHLDNGRESDKGSSILAGQWLEYLRIQTDLFMSGKRPFPSMMDDAYQGLKPADLDALSHFYASQQ